MKKYIILLVIAILIVSGFGSNLIAEPTPSVSWLMDEPASLFDLGLLRLGMVNSDEWVPAFMNEARKFGVTLHPWAGAIYYSWDNNTITIAVHVVGPLQEDLAKKLIVKYKDAILHPERDPESKLTQWILTLFFDHYVYTSKHRPDDLNKNLISVFRFQVSVHESEEVFKMLTATCDFRSDNPTFQKF